MLKWLCLGLFSCACVFAQTRSESPDVIQARARVEALRKQVDAGITPRVKLEEAENTLDDLQDTALLAQQNPTDLTEEEAAQFEEAAEGRLKRRQADLDRHQALVDEGLEEARVLEPLAQLKELAQTLFNLSVQRAELVHEMAVMARIEIAPPESESAPVSESQSPSVQLSPVEERFDGRALITAGALTRMKDAFEKQFHKPLPISADGETAVHKALGFDHRNRIDVALLPDAPEGQWLRHYLETADIPYYAFRDAVAGKATGAHIHIGPPSTRL